MKKIMAAALIAAMLLTCAAGCGKKTTDPDTTSRVLYSDSETDTVTDTESESDEESKDESKTESKKDESKTESKKAESKKTESKKAASSKAASSKAASSKAASSKAASSKTASSKAASSAAASSKTESKSDSSSKAATDSDKATDTSTDSATDTEKTTDTDSAVDTETATDGIIEGSDPFDESEDLIFTYGDETYGVGTSMDYVLDNIGEPDSIDEVGMHTNGVVKTYDYSSLGFRITAHPVENASETYVIEAIEIVSDKVATEKDVTVGTPESKIKEIYGEEDLTEMVNTYRYNSKYGPTYLQFEVDGGKVSRILIAIVD